MARTRKRNDVYPMIPLFSRFPKLRAAIPHLSLGTFPTPVEPLRGIGRRYGRSGLFIKRDDLSGLIYGGNKVRKLEFLLADAKKTGAKRIITSGAAGSNHALATALYSRQCGFTTTLMLFEQHQLPGIGATLLADFATGADMFHDSAYSEHLAHLRNIADSCERADGAPPYIIPAGGSCPTGITGFVNAAFELGEQISRGLLPEPAAIYVAYGTMGTAAGLLLGLRAVGIRSKLIAVRVVPESVANCVKFASLFNETNSLLISGDPSFPRCSFNENDLTIYDDFLGEGYGMTTPAALSAIEEFASADGIMLDPVYTGKAGAAFLADASSRDLADVPLLFWHTKSRCFPPLSTGRGDYLLLPSDFHRYFATGGAISDGQ
ncbi:MAG: pyridoxal-phosphate dependent enzyme [Chitinispirillaceae bacterium]|nr:pyridoxal-phosphate dependent enzyme [Chitinispirillaceae bacterium]